MFDGYNRRKRDFGSEFGDPIRVHKTGIGLKKKKKLHPTVKKSSRYRRMEINRTGNIFVLFSPGLPALSEKNYFYFRE